MPKIEWDDSFSVHNAEIDSQHKKWIEIYNKIHETLMIGDVSAQHIASAEALKAMYDYAGYHFKFEEEYMRKINYPGLAEHRRIHKDFDNLIYTHLRNSLEGKLVINSEIIKLIKNWLLDHIIKKDREYALFLEEGK